MEEEPEVTKKWQCQVCAALITGSKKPSKCQCGGTQLRILMVEGDLPKEELEKIKRLEQMKDFDFQFVWEYELDDYEDEDKDWIIESLVPSRSVGVWTGKRGTFKTFLVLSAIFAVGSGKDFLNRFKTQKGKVIYLDKENGIPIMRQRKTLIKNGLKIDEPLDIGFICFSNLKLDKTKDIKVLEELIKENKPTLLVVDTYRRGISFEENDAGEVSKLFVDVLRPLVEKYKLSIILIHHDKKGESQGDEMDMIRGSSDLANYADFIMKNERKGNNLVLKQLKMRNAPECNPIEINIETNENHHLTFISDGDYEPQTKDVKCAELLILWIVREGIKEFKTREAKEIAFKEGVKETNFKNSLIVLQDKGIIQKKEKGRYEVISKNAKFIG